MLAEARPRRGDRPPTRLPVRRSSRAPRLGLLVDLLEHERFIAALLGISCSQSTLLRQAAARSCRPRPRIMTPLGPQHRRSRRPRALHLAACGRGKAGIAEAMNCSSSPLPTTSGVSLPHGDQRVRLVDAHRHERVVSLHLERRAGPPRQVAVVVMGDQVGDDLGVGLGAELAAACGQALLELDVVLDDPVEDDVDACRSQSACGCALRSLTAAVRRPARVADAGGRRRAGERESCAGRGLQRLRLSGAPAGVLAALSPTSISPASASLPCSASRLPTARTESI